MKKKQSIRIRLVHEFQEKAFSSDWFERAACNGLQTSLFFATTPREHSDFEYFESHYICMGCPVIRECVATAVVRNDDQGFMGIPGVNRQKMDLHSDVDKTIKRAFTEFRNLEPQFNRNGRLLSRRCVACYRRVNKIPINTNDWGGRQSKCADCLLNNKKSGIKQSFAAPVFNEWGALINKVCSKCEKRKGADEFSKRDKGIGGLKSWCKSCMVLNEKAWRDNKKRTKNVKSAEEIIKHQKRKES